MLPKLQPRVAAWQRGPASDLDLTHMKPLTHRTLKVPEAMDSLIETNCNIIEGESTPTFGKEVDSNIFQSSEKDCSEAQTAKATDMVFLILRQGENSLSSWTAFNQSLSKINPELTTVGYMPIIQAPAHQMDTLNTVVQRCMHIVYCNYS